MEGGAVREQGGLVRPAAGAQQQAGRLAQAGAAPASLPPRAGEGEWGMANNQAPRDDRTAHTVPGSVRLAVQDGHGVGQIQRPPHTVVLAAEEQPSRRQGQAGQKHASTTARPVGSPLPGALLPASAPPAGHSEAAGLGASNGGMQAARNSFQGGARQQPDNATWEAPGGVGAAKPGAPQLSSPGRRGDAPSAASHLAQPVRHPAPRFLGGSSQQGSAALRQPLPFGVHLMAGEAGGGRQHQPAGSRQGLPSQGGLPSRGSAAPGSSPVTAWPSGPACPPSQLPSPRLIVRSMDPSHARALSPPGRPAPDGALRKPVRHLDFGAQPYGLPAPPHQTAAHSWGPALPAASFLQGPSPHTAPLPATSSSSPTWLLVRLELSLRASPCVRCLLAARPVPGASPYRGLRAAPDKPEPPPKKKQCNCKNSRCLKLYCECFASGHYCGPECNCQGCCNNAENEVTRQEAVEATLERNPNAFRPKIAPSPDVKNEQEAAAPAAFLADPAATEAPVAGHHHKGCHCKKSGCLKKYCECFQAGVLCTDACKCIDCKNFDGSDERRLLLAGSIDPAPQGPPGYAAPSPPPFKKARLQDRALQSPPQAKPAQGGSGAKSIPGSSYPAGRAPQKPPTRSLLSGVVKADAVQELCKLLAIVTQEVANNFEAQHPGLLAAQQHRQEAAFAAAAARSDDGGRPGTSDDGAHTAVEERRAGGGSPAGQGPGPGEAEEQSPEALLLSCDEELPAEKEVQVALPGGLYGGADEGGGEGAAARLYAAQEQTVLEEFASCLKKIISVGQKRLRQYEETLSPMRPAYSGPPPLHYRPPPAPAGSAFPQRFPAGQAPPASRQPGGAGRYVPQYHQQAPQQQQRGPAVGPAPYRPAYQQQQQQWQPAQAGRQASFRPVQQLPAGWGPAPLALGQPVPRASYPNVAQPPPPLGQPLPSQRHPAVRPTRQVLMRPLAPPHFGQHLRPGGVLPSGFNMQGPRPHLFQPGSGAQNQTAPRGRAPLAPPKVAASPPTLTSGGADNQAGGGPGLR
ncbi:hypothetical protein KFL_002640050 [Klebsormidium nitens]|uniref:CRC domain-containing protein n=1 Tax=Klebsormidium nitens TaxID=105231 RepID=A0A0U9HSQ2_KLENI|nr:hypothetical protein KFL_002640050 [Klebsormidium nitens]|eukprot:GAQ85983.1 hypothetical protein KFL_002640050 [Klebsormidium nitens]